MKEKVIEAAGRTWKTLAENGETNLAQLPKSIKEDETVVYQALGWLAREDKINYSTRNNKVFVSLVESELQAFKNILQSAKTQAKNGKPKRKLLM